MMPEPTLADVLREIERLSDRLERGDARFAEIDARLNTLSQVEAAAATLVDVANTYRLAGMGGRALKWVLGVLAMLAAILTGWHEWMK